MVPNGTGDEDTAHRVAVELPDRFRVWNVPLAVASNVPVAWRRAPPVFWEGPYGTGDGPDHRLVPDP